MFGLTRAHRSGAVVAGSALFAQRPGLELSRYVCSGRTEFVDQVGELQRGRFPTQFHVQGKLVKDIDKLTTALGEVKTMFEASGGSG